jgi:hypothetical protein
MRELAANAEVLTEVVQFVTVELEKPPSDLEGVHRLVWRRRLEPMSNESSVGLTDIETIRVMSDNNIRLVKYEP